MAPTTALKKRSEGPKVSSRVEQNGITKTRSGERKGRGAPSTWSNTWKKRIAVLCICGLPLKQIVEILNVLSNGTTPKVERTAEYTRTKLLGNDWKKLYSTGEHWKSTLRQRMASLRLWEQQSARSRARRRTQKLASSRPESCCDPTRPAFDIPTSVSIRDSYGTDMVNQDDFVPNVGTRSITSSQYRRVSSILRRLSLTSSARHSIKQNLQIRFSLPMSLSTESSSIYAASKSRTKSARAIEKVKLLPLSERASALPRLVAPKPETTSKELEDFAWKVRSRLRRECCSVNSECIHTYIEEAILGTACQNQFYDLVYGLPTVYNAGHTTILENSITRQINKTDCYGHNSLFFASSWAAPPRVILPLLDCTIDINQRDQNGRTFLFYIDAGVFQATRCVCSNPDVPGNSLRRESMIHLSAFECLMQILEQRSFCFDDIDYDGRHFLSYFSTSVRHNWEFDASIFVDRFQFKPAWLHRIAALSVSRDSSGCPLIHPMKPSLPSVSNQRYNLIIDNIRFPTSHNAQACHAEQCLAILQDPYGEDGRTDLIRILENAYSVKGEEDDVLVSVQGCLAKGCNVNARSRDGSTALIVAAKRNCPRVVDCLLHSHADYTYTDFHGFTALDYAVENFRRSRRASAAPTMTSRSFAAATRLLERATSNDSEGKRADSNLESHLRSGTLGREGERSLAVMADLAERVATSFESSAKEGIQQEETYIDGFEQPVSELAHMFRTRSGRSSLT